MVDLETIREELTNNLNQAYSGEEANEFRQELESSFSDSVAEAFADCAGGDGPGSNFQECVEMVAENNGLSDDAKSAFESNVPDGVMNALMNVGSVWDAEAREAVRKITLDADLDTLNRNCAQGNYRSVADEIGSDSTPTNFQDCVSMVSEAQDVRSALRDAYGTS